ncbi:hypothetical protein [Ottowia testudinis]|uniref:Uncharacterized protein n=1 Tax=Ottowia testudinis TaxID=2816950 RepID=A0A975H4Q1_9BURK|nr:hypothetical protein [Ottowia testudinis]QTD47118.1 hypothetical protein J1M35_09745 [Ottowia testudinis]
MFWTMVGFGAARWDKLPLALDAPALAAGFAALRHRQLDAVLAGDAAAHSLRIVPGPLSRGRYSWCRRWPPPASWRWRVLSALPA